jgi:CHAD domain-containing protein
MQADEPMVAALREVVEPRVNKLRKRLKKAKRGDPEGVHDSRTELRRLRADLDLMGHTVFDTEATAQLCRRMHDLEQGLAKTRDADVMIDDLDKYLQRHTKERAGIGELRKLLVKQKHKAERRARRALSGSARRDVVGKLERFLRRKAVVREKTPGSSAKATPTLVRHFTRQEIWRRYDALWAYDARLPGDIETLHKLRSSCRQMRFALEAFSDALPTVKPIARELHRVQDEIGELHDHHIALGLMDRWRRKGRLATTPALEHYLAYHARTRDRIRGRFEPHWLSLFGEEFRRRVFRSLEREGLGRSRAGVTTVRSK